MAVARNTDELARLLWGNGLDRWFSARPGWSLERPVLGDRSVRFVARTPSGSLSFQVEDRDGAGPVLLAGDEGEHGGALQELRSLVASAAGRGLRLERDGRRRLPVVNPGPASGPGRRIELFIASGCNLHCSFCCESERIAHKQFMDWDELSEKLLRARSEGVDVVQFMGGEATLHPRFADALALARELGLGTYVITNLLRWQQRSFAERVGPLLDEVMISLHAWGSEAGHAVTGVRSWWESFGEAAANARETLEGRVRCSTVLTRHNEADLERIAELQLSFGPSAWVMGSAVPVAGTRGDVVSENLTLTELRAMQPRLLALSRRCADAGCRLVFFAFPHCVLGPELWDDSHDLVLGDQDLSDAAPDELEDVTFWSRADYLDRPRPVTLGRTRPPECESCSRASLCGGHYRTYFDERGTQELRPVRSQETA